MNAVIRVSVLVSERLPRWQTETLRAIPRVRGVELHGVFTCGALAQPARRAIADVLYDASDRLLFARTDDELALSATADATTRQSMEFGDIAARMRDCDVLLCLVSLDYDALRVHLPFGGEIWWVAGTAAAAGVQLPGREEMLRGEAATSIGIASFDVGAGGVRWQCVAHVATDAPCVREVVGPQPVLEPAV